ncbi:MAG: enoyl-CoA hydratase/isomerase family protein [Planctomycetota bacterium]|nr:enoyl-CoA hydratase/isomerase family protein [Planctomycetota bacterium]
MSTTPFPIELATDGPFGGICTIRLDQPGRPVVVLDEPLIRRLDATLDALPAGCTGLVLASASPKVFVAGADLKTIVELDDEPLDRYLAFGQRVFGKLSQLPFPTAAAINGAALGGGLEVAMHCDALVAAPAAGGKPYPVGLPEAGLSICPGWGGTNLLPARIEPGEAVRRTATGKPMKFDQAREAGMFDAVADSPDDLLDEARRWVAARIKAGAVVRDGAPSRWIGRSACAAACLRAFDTVRGELPATEAAAAVADAVNAGLTEGWQAALDCERRHLVRLRRTPDGAAAIQTFFERSAAKA